MWDPNSANSIKGTDAEIIVKNWLDAMNVWHCKPEPPADGFGDGGDIELADGTILDVKTPSTNTGNICCSLRKNITIDYYVGVDYYNNIVGAMATEDIKNYRTLPYNNRVHLVPASKFSLKLLIKLCNIH